MAISLLTVQYMWMNLNEEDFERPLWVRQALLKQKTAVFATSGRSDFCLAPANRSGAGTGVELGRIQAGKIGRAVNDVGQNPGLRIGEGGGDDADVHPGAAGGLYAGVGIFKNQARSGRRLQPFGGDQEDIWVGFTVLNMLRPDNGIELIGQV
jgi:hypothetical protein